MIIEAREIRHDDVLQLSIGHGRRKRSLPVPVKSIRYGGHVSRLGVSSTPPRLAGNSKVVINERYAFGQRDLVAVLRSNGEVERMAEAA